MFSRISTQKLIALLAGTILAMTSVQAQTTWYVDDDAPSDPGPGDPTVSDPAEDGSADHPFDAIQEGIDAAIDGDTVLVQDGTYAGAGNWNISYGGKAIALRSVSGAESTTVDCDDEGPAFRFDGEETTEAVLDGLTVRGARGERAIFCEPGSPTITNCVVTQNADGGIFCSRSSPVIRSCRIVQNWGSSGVGLFIKENSGPLIESCTISENQSNDPTPLGGGIYCRESNPRIVRCEISGNVIPEHNARGGGIYCRQSNLVLADCVVANNRAEWGWGGGIFLYQNSHRVPVIANCTIARNSANEGGGVYCYEGTAFITNCEIRENTASHTPLFDAGGAGIQSYEGTPVITACTIVENSTELYGGGMLVQRTVGPLVSNSILWDNSAIDGSEIAMTGPSGYPPTMSVSYSDVRGGESGALILEGSVLEWGPGNLDSDPSFADPGAGDYRLAPGSPCIDAADSTAVPADVVDLDRDGDTDERTPFDLDGNPRFVDDPATDDTGVADPPAYPEVVDMGAYEFQIVGLSAFLDIKPGSCPNPLNVVSHGVLPMAICGTADFDVALIDPNSLTLARADGVGGSVTPLMGPPGPGIHIDDVATPFDGELCDCHDLHGDGIDDLTLKFDTEALVAELELTDLPGRTTLELVVTGELVDGTPFTASDCVRLAPHQAGPGQGRSDFPGGDGSAQPNSGYAVPDEDALPSSLSASDDDDDPTAPERDDREQPGQASETPLASALACGPISPAFLTLTISGLWLSRFRYRS